VKIALFQRHGNDALWHAQALPGLLAQAGDSGCDLAVFPEGLPFMDDRSPIAHEAAVRQLEDVAGTGDGGAFIAGGCVREGRHVRNRAYLVSGGQVTPWYDKQIVWPGETFTPGRQAQRFTWPGGA